MATDNKEITCVFQDCPMCGDKGRKLARITEREGVTLRKVSFASPEGRELCERALFDHGIRTMPFFVNGKRFASTLTEALRGARKADKKVVRKKRKNTKETAKNEPSE